ncbi:cytochrome C [Pseudoroseomonas deserti]|uniref:Cytochrome C n=1 Tax=Teichococcus deserti TaxID=1817963 RepID=A0A1V2GUK6_9PROT|nr:cytochrome c [Pseudoroseomonas deserti]ONG44596.1 cytochrome C [Pseudoroseomonas deserti]
MPFPRLAALMLGALIAALPARAAELVLNLGGAALRLRTAELLARPDAASITIPADVSYAMAERRYRAVPLRALLGAMEGVETVEAQASDGFASQIPAALLRSGPAEPWIAVEDPAAPWPVLPGKAASAGPFYLVWRNPAASDVRPEQWPYMLARLTAVAPPLRRWPQLAVAASLPAGDPARHGAEVYVTQCLACHRMKGAGAGEMGPDLGAPMPALAYLTEAGLRALIRDPAAVRTWPARAMPAFDEAALPPAELEALVAYLRHQAGL